MQRITTGNDNYRLCTNTCTSTRGSNNSNKTNNNSSTINFMLVLNLHVSDKYIYPGKLEIKATYLPEKYMLKPQGKYLYRPETFMVTSSNTGIKLASSAMSN